MRNDRRNYVIVGTFVIAMAVALVAWIALMTGRTGATDPYHVVYTNVTGLKAGTRILFEGFPVGLIDGIRPEDRDGRRVFRIDVSIERGWPIPEDSVATIATGLFSAAVLDVQGGESDTLLEPGAQIPSQEPADVFAAVNTAADRLTATLDDFADLASDELLDRESGYLREFDLTEDEANAMIMAAGKP